MDIRLSEVISALSYALDITEGQPMGHAVRSCAIGMRVGEEIGLDDQMRSSLFYALLLKDAGCSSNAAKLSALFGADDFELKRDRKLTNHLRPFEALKFTVRHARARRLAAIARSGADGARAMTELRCERGADIARMIELSEATAEAIKSLDEHWDGNGYPYGVAGDAIPLLGRIVCLAQTAEVFFAAAGPRAVFDVAAERRGTWFDPALVDALRGTRRDRAFWSALGGHEPHVVIGAFEPEDRIQHADGERLDRVAEAFALIVDAKSPYTGSHSVGVARIAVSVADVLGYGPHALRDLRRTALLHDIGKLGVSNLILDKPGKLDEEEWAQMRRHPELTVRILRARRRLPRPRGHRRRPPRAARRPRLPPRAAGRAAQPQRAHPRRRRRLRGAERRPALPGGDGARPGAGDHAPRRGHRVLPRSARRARGDARARPRGVRYAGDPCSAARGSLTISSRRSSALSANSRSTARQPRTTTSLRPSRLARRWIASTRPSPAESRKLSFLRSSTIDSGLCASSRRISSSKVYAREKSSSPLSATQTVSGAKLSIVIPSG